MPPPNPRTEQGESSPNIHRVFHALGDPTRRAIVERLSEGPISVSQLALPLLMTLAAVVQHLQVLEESGLVRTEKIDEESGPADEGVPGEEEAGFGWYDCFEKYERRNDVFIPGS